MARKRIDLGPGADERILALMGKGAPFQVIATELGVSPATAKRRMAELRGQLAERRAARRKAEPAPPPGPAPLPSSEEEIPENTPLEQIDAWLKIAKDELEAARVAGESEMVAKMVRLASSLLTLKQKATPVPKADPNDHPDMIAAAKRMRDRWLDLLSKARSA